MEENLEKNNKCSKSFLKYNSIGYAIIFEQEEDGYFLTAFKSKRKAIKFAKEFFEWVNNRLSSEESIIYKDCFERARQYKINLLNGYTTYICGCYDISNGIQSMSVKLIDLEFFNIDMFCYERKAYVTSFDCDIIETIKSEVHQELLARIIPN